MIEGEFEIKAENVMEYSLSAEQGISDMIEISELNHATLLHNLKVRYYVDEIFTYVGPTLLVVNPFKRMEYLYTDKQIKAYQQVSELSFTLPDLYSQKLL
jgi:myosin heavy subunit